VPLLTAPAIAPGTLADGSQLTLTVDELVLRGWRDTDAPAVVIAYADPQIQQWHARSMTESEARAWIAGWSARRAAETGVGWAITADDAVLGQISLRKVDLHEAVAEISYWVTPGARGRGVATRALRGLSAWAFEELGLHRLELTHSTANPVSCRVATAAGFAVEGIKREEALHLDGWHDMHMHGRLKGDPDR
jgi:[ribosomal protein S5]-alanine N-acetyltransferase